MNELDTKYVDEALNYKKKAQKPFCVKWGGIAACLCLIAALGIYWSNVPFHNIKYGEKGLISESITQIYVDFTVEGKTETYVISGSDLETLKEWSDTLEYSLCKAPVELVYGNQGYVFKDEQQNVLFSYISYTDNWYLIIEGDWYDVSNPSTPLPNVIVNHFDN